MSKIEEALKKAKETHGKSISGLKAVNEAEKNKPGVRGLVTSNNNTISVIHRESSTKEIALMDSGKSKDLRQLSELKIIYSEMSDSMIANIYRDLRTKLIQKSQGQNFIAMLTSCTSGDDSSGITLNLANAFSFDESKTSLIIDCNLNNPRLDHLFGLDSSYGLTDYLENEDIDIESILQKTGISRLKVIPAGTSKESSAEYFTSMRMRELMAGLLSRYSDRYIFIDSAPITESADTRILVDLCDFVVLVVPYGKVTKNRVNEAVNSIGKDKLLGVVFVDTPKIPRFRIPGTKRARA